MTTSSFPTMFRRVASTAGEILARQTFGLTVTELKLFVGGVLAMLVVMIAPPAAAEPTVRPGDESGRVDTPDTTDSTARTIARGVLFVPRVVVGAALLPVDETSVAPFVTLAGLLCGIKSTFGSKNCESRVLTIEFTSTLRSLASAAGDDMRTSVSVITVMVTSL